MMIQNIFSLEEKQSSHLFHILMECMEHRESVSTVHVPSLGSLHFLLPFLLFLYWIGICTGVISNIKIIQLCLCQFLC